MRRLEPTRRSVESLTKEPNTTVTCKVLVYILYTAQSIFTWTKVDIFTQVGLPAIFPKLEVALAGERAIDSKTRVEGSPIAVGPASGKPGRARARARGARAARFVLVQL